MKLRETALFVLALLPATARAHYLWIEEECSGEARCEVAVYYGEYEEGVRESKATRLTERKGVEAWIAGGQQREKLPLEMQEDRFVGSFSSSDPKQAENRAVLAIDEHGPVVDFRKYDIGIVRPIFYARRGVGKSSEHMMLDILPKVSTPVTAGKPLELTVAFHDAAPTEPVEVKLHGPNGWTTSTQSGSNGSVTFVPPAPGFYLAEVIVLERKPGSFEGTDYEAVRHRATLSLDVTG